MHCRVTHLLVLQFPFLSTNEKDSNTKSFRLLKRHCCPSDSATLGCLSFQSADVVTVLAAIPTNLLLCGRNHAKTSIYSHPRKEIQLANVSHSVTLYYYLFFLPLQPTRKVWTNPRGVYLIKAGPTELALSPSRPMDAYGHFAVPGSVLERLRHGRLHRSFPFLSFLVLLILFEDKLGEGRQASAAFILFQERVSDPLGIACVVFVDPLHSFVLVLPKAHQPALIA